jgi:hypothetical protein
MIRVAEPRAHLAQPLLSHALEPRRDKGDAAGDHGPAIAGKERNGRSRAQGLELLLAHQGADLDAVHAIDLEQGGAPLDVGLGHGLQVRRDHGPRHRRAQLARGAPPLEGLSGLEQLGRRGAVLGSRSLGRESRSGDLEVDRGPLGGAGALLEVAARDQSLG